MIRIEIVANHSVEENILEALAKEQVGKYYTKFPSILGVGSAGPRMGDAVWPEENFALIIWCELEEALGIKRAIAKVKEQFPGEGIKFFSLPEIKVKSAAPQGASPAQKPGAVEPPTPVSQEPKPAAQPARHGGAETKLAHMTQWPAGPEPKPAAVELPGSASPPPGPAGTAPLPANRAAKSAAVKPVPAEPASKPAGAKPKSASSEQKPVAAEPKPADQAAKPKPAKPAATGPKKP